MNDDELNENYDTIAYVESDIEQLENEIYDIYFYAQHILDDLSEVEEQVKPLEAKLKPLQAKLDELRKAD